MTPDEAQYYLLMLRLGEYAAYDQALDRLLEEQDPLSDLVLELACCMSDRRETISVLRNFLLDHPADQRQLMESQLAWVRKQYAEKAMTAVDAAEYLARLYDLQSHLEPWWEIYIYIDDYELYLDGMISLSVFEQCFEARFLRDEMLNPWKLQEGESREKSLVGRLLKLIGR